MTVELRSARVDDEVAAALIEALQGEFMVRYGDRDDTPVVPDDFAPPRGAFVVAWAGDVPVGCGGWRRVADVPGTGEVKRMYVVPAWRRRGVGRAVLAHLEDSARAAGLDRLRLETGGRQPEAIALYLDAGWAPVAAYGPHAGHDMARHLGKALTAPRG